MTRADGAEHARLNSAASRDDARWGVAGHISSLVNLVGIPSPIGPLVVWLLVRSSSAFAAQEAKESLNFSLSVWIYGALFLVVAVVSVFQGNWGTAILMGVLWLALIVSSLVFSIFGAVRASEGKPYLYPLNLRLIG